MRGVEEIPRGRPANVYFSSLYHANPSLGRSENLKRPSNSVESSKQEGINENGKDSRQSNGSKRKRVNYNVQQIQAEQFLTARPKSKSISAEFENEMMSNGEPSEANISIAELRRATRRFDELNRENYNENVKIEIPKSITGLVINRTSNASPAVKRFLVSKKTWNNYMDELNKSEIKLITTGISPLEVKPNMFQLEKLCTICGAVSYSSCIKCSLRVCSVKCQNIHNETRCTHF